MNKFSTKKTTERNGHLKNLHYNLHFQGLLQELKLLHTWIDFMEWTSSSHFLFHVNSINCAFFPKIFCTFGIEPITNKSTAFH